VKLLVQVKHHQGLTNEQGICQLKEIRKAHPGEYDDHEIVFVTSASVSETVFKFQSTLILLGFDGVCLEKVGKNEIRC